VRDFLAKSNAQLMRLLGIEDEGLRGHEAGNDSERRAVGRPGRVVHRPLLQRHQAVRHAAHRLRSRTMGLSFWEGHTTWLRHLLCTSCSFSGTRQSATPRTDCSHAACVLVHICISRLLLCLDPVVDRPTFWWIGGTRQFAPCRAQLMVTLSK